MILDDKLAAAVVRVMLVYRAAPGGVGSPTDRDLRAIVAAWVGDPSRPIDTELFNRVARRLRASAARRNEADADRLRTWADLLTAITSGDQRRIVAARYAAGESSRLLAVEAGISDTAMLAHIRRAGVATRGRAPGVDKATRARAVELYLGGMSARQVATEVGAVKPRVLDWVRDAGHQPRPARGRADGQGRTAVTSNLLT